jgi:hypothetical protein
MAVLTVLGGGGWATCVAGVAGTGGRGAVLTFSVERRARNRESLCEGDMRSSVEKSMFGVYGIFGLGENRGSFERRCMLGQNSRIKSAKKKTNCKTGGAEPTLLWTPGLRE